MSLGRLLAFVNDDGAGGPILLVDGFVEEEPLGDMCGDVADYNLPGTFGQKGLLIFEGWWYCDDSPDPDVRFTGEWRQLSHWEMCRVRHGMVPWDKWEEPQPPPSRPAAREAPP